MNGTRQITLLIPLSFIVYVIGSSTPTRIGKGSKSRLDNSVNLPDAKRLIAWGLMFLMLILLGDFPQTGELAAALAWLITFTIMLTYGTGLFDQISTWIGA